MVSPAVATPWKRAVALIIDSIIAAIPAGIIGGPISFANANIGIVLYSGIWMALFGLRDALPIPALNGASIGKKLFGLQAVRSDGSPCDFEASLKRNAPLLVSSAAYLIAGLIQFIGIPFIGFILTVIGIILGLIVLIVEAFKVFTDEKGLRIGDLFASTYVVEHGGSIADQVINHQPPPPPAGGPPTDPPPPPA